MTVVLKGVSFLIIALATIHCTHWKIHRLPMVRCFGKSSIISNRWSFEPERVRFVLNMTPCCGSSEFDSYRLDQR